MISLFIFTSNIRGMNYGIGTYVSELTSGLLKYPDITFYHVFYNSGRVKEFTTFRDKDKIVNIHIPGPQIKITSEIQIKKYASRVVDFLEELFINLPNVVIQVNYPSSFSIVKELKKRFSYPVLSVIHSANWQFLSVGNKQKFIELWGNREQFDKVTLKELLEEEEFYKAVDKIVSVTDYMKKFVSIYYSIDPDKVSVIRNGIDYSKIRVPSRTEKRILKQQLGFGISDKIALFIGRLDNGKGLQHLLQAFNEVFIKNKKIKLVIIGEDSGTEPIRQFLSCLKDSWHNVTFTGFLSYFDLNKFYQIADVGILPSLYDHCPYVALEMAAHDIPLIISDTEGLNEMFDSKQAFYLKLVVDVKGSISLDKHDIANALLTMLNDAKLRKRIVKNYPELIRGKFSTSGMGNEMYKILTKMNNDKIVEL